MTYDVADSSLVTLRRFRRGRLQGTKLVKCGTYSARDASEIACSQNKAAKKRLICSKRDNKPFYDTRQQILPCAEAGTYDVTRSMNDSAYRVWLLSERRNAHSRTTQVVHMGG